MHYVIQSDSPRHIGSKPFNFLIDRAAMLKFRFLEFLSALLSLSHDLKLQLFTTHTIFYLFLVFKKYQYMYTTSILYKIYNIMYFLTNSLHIECRLTNGIRFLIKTFI